MTGIEHVDVDKRRNFLPVLDRMESIYLGAIRVLVLLSATLAILFAFWLVGTGIYRISQDVKSVHEATATVNADEITQIDLSRPTIEDRSGQSKAQAIRNYYAGFSKRYLTLYQQKFEQFKQSGDATIKLSAFDEKFVKSRNKIEGSLNGTRDFAEDRTDHEALLAAMRAAANTKTTVDRLMKYRDAKWITEARTLTGTRPEVYCSYYGYSMCLDYDVRQVPYRRVVTEKRLPAGIVNHGDLFEAYQQRYLTLLDERRQRNARTAETARDEILIANTDGWARLWTAVKVVAGFVAIMFLFLLIALERHQRKIARSIAAEV